MIHIYYSSNSKRNPVSILRLSVLTFYHCQLVKKYFPVDKNDNLYTLYYHFMETHIPVLYRLFCLLDLTSEIEGI